MSESDLRQAQIKNVAPSGLNLLLGRREAFNHAGEIGMLALNVLEPWMQNPFRGYSESEMLALMESISTYGLITPIIVRRQSSGKYEIITGHNRVEAHRRLGLEVIRAQIVELDDDQATLVAIDSNLMTREKIFIMDQARALKLRRDAIIRRGARTDLQGGFKHDTLAQLGEGEMSRRKVARILRLNHLIEPLAKLMDEEVLSLLFGVEISYLDPQNQAVVARVIQSGIALKLSVDNANALRTLGQVQDDFSESDVRELLNPAHSHAKGARVKRPFVVFSEELASSLRDVRKSAKLSHAEYEILERETIRDAKKAIELFVGEWLAKHRGEHV